MFIGIIGTPCSGKHTVAGWLVKEHNFKALSLRENKRDDLHPLIFKSAENLLLYVTENWEDNFVTCDIDSEEILASYRRRPFFLLIAVDGPVMLRYERYRNRKCKLEKSLQSLEQFIENNDHSVFQYSSESPSPSSPSLYKMTSTSDLTIVNAFHELSCFYSHLSTLEITNHERLRPIWDSYFMYMADLAAKRSNCMKRRVGCILVRNHRVVATGYNGTPMGLKNCNEGGCPKCNMGSNCGDRSDYCLCLHAEENALLEAGRARVGEKSILYCNT
ncbi:9338_t:CDS:2 [Paraglomus brasilianum]|uniref:dCMP deaminase n=1 Tax=Paraglomus brasilianum TaxID=144538 RepID=A0A9N9F240_9GLOM|nr:9338_t:CDS:2 [Paraglomus brasilianum]